MKRGKMKISIKLLHKDAKIPVFAHGSDQDAGADLCAVQSVFLSPGVPQLVKTGISLELPPGYEGQVRSRSGMALKYGVSVLNSPGTVDPSYRGELGVILMWTKKPGADGVVDTSARLAITAGDRIAQLVIAKYEQVDYVEGDLTESERGGAGFGSTGA